MRDEHAKEKGKSMEEKIGGKMKSVASIPANYVSILQLQERWLKEKEQKHKEKDLLLKRGVKQQIDGQRRFRREEGVMKLVEAMEPREKLKEKGLGIHCGVNRWKKEPKCVEKEEVSTTRIVSNKDENRGDLRETEKNNPVKEGTRRVCTSKGENAAKDSIAEDTQFQNRWIKKRVEEEGETREVSGPARQGYYQNQRHDWSSTRVIRATSSMVWVKKGKNDGSCC